ncbi:uncharacterized protein LOC110806368 isoform X4 [Carica papaya]|uniref:uncharacterized protein LOC110806368 isoform X4 n=2 Tax=Carica papaya TaxID=3649 RepID=UPI000B8CE67B|nr:uncharacterized protein LOC110806368 isoform X4 [Carica papaya]
MEYIYIMLMQYSLTKISFKKTKCFSLFSLEGACLHYFHAAENDVQIKNVVRNSCLGDEACGGMYRANTMASAIVSSFQVGGTPSVMEIGYWMVICITGPALVSGGRRIYDFCHLQGSFEF